MLRLVQAILFAGLCCPAFAQTWNCTKVLDWNFFGAKLTQNNLGGHGPNFDDKHELRYSGVLNHAESGKQADLVVTAPDWGTSYQVKNNLYNGLWSNGSDAPGSFGQINILDSTEVLLTFTLVEEGSDTPLEIDPSEKLLFSVYDLDHKRDRPQEVEYVKFVTPVASYSVTADTTVKISGEASDGTLYAESTRPGNLEDNPVDPLKMSAIAEQSKISVTYVGLSSWQIVWGDKEGNPGGGRNMLFAGRSEGDCACIGVSDWTIDENLQYNNLGGMGPVTSDPPELRYSKVFTTGSERQSIDLVVKVAAGAEYSPFKVERNGLWPYTDGTSNTVQTQMGQININSGSNCTFDFVFVESGTDTPYSLSNVLFSVYDLDQSILLDTHKRPLENHEFVVFPEAVTNWTLTENPPTQIKQSGSNADGTLQFTSTTFGTLEDNPTDPEELSPLQQSRSVTVWYSDTSEFQVTFGHEYVGGVPKVGKKKPIGGRNVIFAGPGIYCPQEEKPSWSGGAPPTSLATDFRGGQAYSSSSNSNTLAIVAVLVFVAAVAAVAAVVMRRKQKQPQDVTIPIDTTSSVAYDSCPSDNKYNTV